MPALPTYLIEPIWEQFIDFLLPARKVDYPFGCHRPRIPDRVVFDKLVEVLVFGCAYWRGTPMIPARQPPCAPSARRVDLRRGDGHAPGVGARSLRPDHRPRVL